jgi:hypothetical protein
MNRGRPRKDDRVVNPYRATKEELACDYAMAPLEAAETEAERQWGRGGLLERVTPALAAKYGRTRASLQDALDANDVERVTDRVAACIRGLAAMEAEALSLGHKKPTSGAMVYQDLEGGAEFGILYDATMWRKAQEEHPGLRIYTIREIAILIEAAERGHPFLAGAKEAFPGAEISAIRRNRTDELIEDEIPF